MMPTFPAWAAVSGGSGYSVGGHWGRERGRLLLAPHGGSGVMPGCALSPQGYACASLSLVTPQ